MFVARARVCHMRPTAATCGHLWPPAATCGHLRPPVATCNRLRPPEFRLGLSGTTGGLKVPLSCSTAGFRLGLSGATGGWAGGPPLVFHQGG